MHSILINFTSHPNSLLFENSFFLLLIFTKYKIIWMEYIDHIVPVKQRTEEARSRRRNKKQEKKTKWRKKKSRDEERRWKEKKTTKKFKKKKKTMEKKSRRRRIKKRERKIKKKRKRNWTTELQFFKIKCCHFLFLIFNQFFLISRNFLYDAQFKRPNNKVMLQFFEI